MQTLNLNSLTARNIALSTLVFISAAITTNQASAKEPPPSNPEFAIRPGNDFGVAPAVIKPFKNGSQLEFKGPSLHPQVPPTFNGGSVTYTIPFPEKKR